MHDVTALIVHWNTPAALSRLVESLVPLGDRLSQIVVLDNASDGGLPPLPPHPRLRIQRFEQNRGFAGAANWGIQQASTDFVLLMNPDVEIISDSLLRLWERRNDDPRTGILCGPLVGADGDPQTAFQIRPLPTPVSLLCDALFLDEVGAWVGRDRALPTPVPADSRQPIAVEQPAAAFWLLRKTCWADVGGFDESFYPAWYEDVDFCLRALRAGWKFLLYMDCPIRHAGGLALQRLGFSEFSRIFYSNQLRYARKHHPWSYPWLYLPIHAGMLIRRLLVKR